ncbi:NAD-dependent epimerase [Flavobacterium noncentrifugens]|nr:NAD-dependent epimerase/dehydratase family protein [Flavobacterium noncentrifugens]GEP51515.1 NAD-dependent epimerase [Flavobacterium noncentrifugens]
MILVTGATGLIGSHLALHLLESGRKIRAIYRDKNGIERTRSLFKLHEKESLFDSIEWLEADITDVPSLERVFTAVDCVYHCAAFISFDPKDEEKLRKTNIEGTANIVNFCLANSVKKLCYVSSIATLGDLKEHENTIVEETEWNPEKPHSDYAISKYGAEMEIWRGLQEGLEAVVVNPGIILGPSPDITGWKTGSCEIFTKVANGLPFYTKGSTGFVSVNDVVKIMKFLMESDVSGARFILISENLTFEKVLKKIASALKVKIPSIYAKRWMTAMSWRFDWILSVVFQRKRKLSKSMAHTLHSTDLISSQKIKTLMAFEFKPIDKVIEEVAAFYKK